MDEIASWLDNNQNVSNYIILDDEDEFSVAQHMHFVKVDATIGITTENIDEAIRLLST